MKKIYSFIMVALLGFTANVWAADVTNPTDTLDFSVITSLDQAEKTPKYGKFAYSTGTASNANMKPNISTSQKAFRLWPGNTVTLSANEGLTISKIEFTYTSSNTVEVSLSGTEGTFANGVWTGSAAEVTFKNGGSGYTQAKIAKIVVSYSGSTTAAVNAPRPDKKGVAIGDEPADSNVVNDQDTIALTADSATTIYYTLDETDPTVASTKYSDPIVITATTTIKAVAVNAEGKSSDVMGYTYYINKYAMGDSVVYYESFDRCLGYNGDTLFTQPNSSKITLNRGGEFSGTHYAGNQCVYLARQYGQNATFTTPAIDSIAASATLTFRIASASESAALELTATNAKLSETSFTPGLNAWKDITVELTGVTKGAAITFSGRDLFLDEVQIKNGPDAVDAIKSVTAKADTDANAPAYNLAGQRVSASYKGVVIQNGHKFVRK